jgi:hypothetical protein
VATTGKAYGDACEVAQAIELDASGQVLHSLVAGGVGYFTYVKVDTEIVPLGSCGYGLVTSGLAVEGDPHYKTVVLRLNEKLEVIGLWRWNISASYADVETVEGDLLLLSVTPVPIPGSYNSNAIYHIVRIDGDTGELEWQTDVDIPEHGAHELVVLPDNRIVLVGGIKGDWPDPQGFNAYPLLTVLSPDGCALAHVLYKDQLTTTGTPVKSFSNVVALSNTLLADGDAAWVHFLDLPPTP